MHARDAVWGAVAVFFFAGLFAMYKTSQEEKDPMVVVRNKDKYSVQYLNKRCWIGVDSIRFEMWVQAVDSARDPLENATVDMRRGTAEYNTYVPWPSLIVKRCGRFIRSIPDTADRRLAALTLIEPEEDRLMREAIKNMPPDRPHKKK